MKQPLVTVLMPNYNGGRFIAKTIQSVLDQTMTDFEFLIVEDASTDNSQEIIDSFSDARIRVLKHPKNEHMCLALNNGLREARGKYIARIDNDDYWYADKLEKQIAYMTENPSCGASFTWVDVIDEEERRLEAHESFFVDLFRVSNHTREEWLHHFFFKGSCLCHPSAVYPLDLVRALGGYRNTLVQIQDFDLWIRIAKKHNLYVIEEPLMSYRHALKGGNVSAVNPTTAIRTQYEMYNVIGAFFDDMNDEEFFNIFQQDFKYKDASTHEEFLCEQALLLLEPKFCGNATKIEGMNRLAELLDQENTRLILRDKYAVTQMNFYELSASPALFYDDPRLNTINYSGRQLARMALERLKKYFRH